MLPSPASRRASCPRLESLPLAETWALVDGDSVTLIVLTIGHLDHTPENCDDDNLRAWCQRCHNTYDAPHRAANRRRRRLRRDTTASLLREGDA